MPRPTWNGAIGFGLVNIPVKAYTAVHDHDVHFHQFEARTGARIRYAKVSAVLMRETARKCDTYRAPERRRAVNLSSDGHPRSRH
jgi:non-homologous end joining protein Ku